MWKMLPVVNSEEEGEEFFAKWVDCQKRRKNRKNQSNQEKKKAAQKTLYLFLHNKYSIQTQPA